MPDDMEASFAECGVFVRDTRLSHEVLGLYRPGILLREPTYCDASYQLGGFVAPHRFLIFSANAKAFPAENPWAMVVWLRGRIFKVIDRVSDGVRTQIALLEIPEYLVGAFLGDSPNGIEQDYAGHARSIFEQLSNAPVVPALDTHRWRERLTYPVGIDGAGGYFRLYGAEDLADGASRQRRCLAVGYQARVLANAGALRDAEAVLQKSVEGLREFGAEAGDALANLLSAAADLRMQLGAFRQAEADLHEAFGLAKQIAEDRLPVAGILNRLGHLYQREGHLDAAERFYLHALKIKRRVAGERSAEVVTTLVSLAALYERQAAFAKAEEYLVEAQAAAEAAGVPVDAVLFNNLGRLQQATGRYDEALHNLRSALALSEMDYLQHMALLNNLAELHAARGDTAEALGLYAEVLSRQREIIDQIGASRTSEHLLDLLGTSRSTLDQYISLVLSESPAAAAQHTEHLVDLVLQRKCLGMDTFAGKRDILRQATEPGLADEVRRLATVRQQIAEARLAGRDPTDKGSFVDDLLRLTDAADALESAIAGKVPQLAARLTNSRITSTDVTNAVPAGSALVEIIRYSRFDFTAVPARDEAPWRPARYLAVVFTSATAEKPRLIDLGDAFEIDSLVAQVRSRITGRRELPQRSSGHSTSVATATESAAARLHHLVFAPLRGVFGDVSTLFIAADGDLARLPFQILPNGDGTQLIDHYTISYLTTARDLVRLGMAAQIAPGPPMVIAGPDFSLGEHSPTGKPLAPLTAAYQEGIEIGQVLQCSPLLAERAVKAALQHVRSPVILHLATHGFVLKHQPPLRPFEIQAGMTVMDEDPRRQSIVLDGIRATPHRMVLADDSGFGRMSSYNLANPLLRAGLALAGANTWLNGGQPPPPAANGILTAHEVSDLDLNGTQLVVLSACDSALGEILPGEGVFGLQRSFILAGARTIVSTLWKIPDEPARILVNQFYQRLLAGQPRAAALRQAQLHLRSQGQPERAWAAFICHGDHRPLPQQAPSNAGKG